MMCYSKMRGAGKFKVADAQQVKTVNIYRNAKLKLLKTSAVTQFNKITSNILKILYNNFTESIQHLIECICDLNGD